MASPLGLGLGPLSFPLPLPVAVAIAVCGVALVLGVVAHFLTRPRGISLKGKHVLIVGGSTGIGLAMAEQAVREGASVSIIARSASKLQQAQEKLRAVAVQVSKGDAPGAPVVCGVPGDASVLREMEKAVGEATGRCGPIHVLVCCQGICRPHAFEDWAVEEQREHMEANYWGTVNVLKAGALDSLKASSSSAPGEPRILFVSSQAGQVGVYGYTAYAASKFALRGLAECLAQELLPHGIKVSLLFPPDTDTPQLAEESKTKTSVTKAISSSNGPPMAAKDVAAAALEGVKRGDFLVSANFTGYLLSVCTAGLAPASSLGGLIAEVLLAPLCRIIGVLTLSDFHRIIRQHTAAPLPKAKDL